MLFINKISKSILSVVAFTFLSSSFFSVNFNLKIYSTAYAQRVSGRSVEVTDETSFINAVKDANNTSITVKSGVKLTKQAITDLNDRLNNSPLEILFWDKGSLLIDVTDDVEIKGNNNLTLKRETSTEALLQNNGMKDVTISGIYFDNGLIGDIGTSVIKNNTTGKFNANGNIVINGFINETENMVNFEFNNVTGQTYSYLDDLMVKIGKSTGNDTNPVGQSANIETVSVKVSLSEANSAGKVLTYNTTKVAGEGFKFELKDNQEFFDLITNLKPGTDYKLSFTVVAEDNSKPASNKYELDIQHHIFKTFKITTTTTTNSATMNIGHAIIKDFDGGEGLQDIYPLELRVISQNGGNIVKSEILASDGTINIPNLSPNTGYTYEIVFIDEDKNREYPIAVGNFRTQANNNNNNSSNGGSNITGGGSSTGNSSITSSDILKSEIRDVFASLSASTTITNSLKNGKDFTTNVEGVTVSFDGTKIRLDGLVPEKEYKNMVITYTDEKNTRKTVSIATFKTKISETKLRQFIVDVYKYSMNRIADEVGFAYWEKNLKNKNITAQKFVLNLLSEKEFIERHKTTEDKIEGLYKVMVNRNSDAEGLKFWVDRYSTLIKQGMNESTALLYVVDNMVNEPEFIERVNGLNI